jgi:hypothetical protein
MIRSEGNRLVFECDACHKRVAGTIGWLHVDLSEVGRVERAMESWRKQNPGPAISGGALLDLPELARWQVHHSVCDPNPDGDDYWFHVGRCDTWPKIVGRTAHLMGKRWFEYTDWQTLLEQLAAGADT